MKKESGITLIALVITIIVMLILAGVVLNLVIGERGIFKTAQKSAEEHIKAKLKEEIELAIIEIESEELLKGNIITLETLKNGQLGNKLNDIQAEIVNNEIIGIYKEYNYIIDSQFKVEILGKAEGVKPTGIVEILNKNYTFNTIQIKITANVEMGKIEEITAPEGVKLLTDISNNEKIYEVSKSGEYNFVIKASNGRKTTVKANVENILEAPRISIKEITTNSFKIKVENNYPEGSISKYQYYVENVQRSEENNSSYTVTGLIEGTQYNNIKVIAYLNTESRESNIEKIETSKKPNAPTINLKVNGKKQALEYPLLTKKGMMNGILLEGDNATLEIINKEEKLTNYYSLDRGNSWIKYNEAINIVYPGTRKLLAKSVNNYGVESEITEIDKYYYYDPNITPIAEDALETVAYDGDDRTYYNSNSNKNKFYTDKDIDIYKVCFNIDNSSTGKVILMLDDSGYIHMGEGEFIRDRIFHCTCYGKNSLAWAGHFCSINMKLYEIYYDESL